MAEVQIPISLGNRIIFVENVKAKPSSHRSRAPGFLRIAPIDSGQQITELGRGDRHRAVDRARPQEAAPFQPLREQAGSLAVMPDHLQQVASATTKAKQLSAQRIAPQYLLYLQRQARKALPHVGVAGRQLYPHAARNRNHGSVSSPRMMRSRLSTSTSQSTITRRPFTLTISIRRQPSPVTFSGCSGTITAGTNPSAALHRRHGMVSQVLHEHAASLSAASHAYRSRRLTKCAKDSGHYPPQGPIIET